MDLLFKRYASPFLMLEQMLNVGRFSDFVTKLVKIKNEETNHKTLWGMYLHHPFLDKSFEQFKDQIGFSDEIKEEPESVDFETTIKDSISILNNFVPE